MIHPRHSELFRIWSMLRGRRAMPRVSDVSAAVIASHLQDLLIIERGMPSGNRLRLAGTACCAIFGRELTGKPFDSLWRGADRADLARLLDAIFGESSAVSLGAIGHRIGNAPLRLACMFLPVAGEDGHPARVLGSLVVARDPDGSLDPVDELQLGSVRFLNADQAARGIHAAGVPRASVALQKGHLVLLKSMQSEHSGSGVIRR
jgi:hypothetical protein